MVRVWPRSGTGDHQHGDIVGGTQIMAHDRTRLPIPGSLGRPLSRRTFVRGAIAAPVAASALGMPAVLRHAAAQDQVKLVLLTHWGAQPQKDPLDQIIAEYTQANPNVSIEHQTVDFAQLLNRITTGQLGGEAPDMYHFYNLWLPEFVNSQLIATPPDDVLSDIQSGYAEGTIGGASYNDQVWGYPTEVNVWQLLYNKQMFDAAGITAAPETWDEFKDAATKLTQKDASGKVTVAGMLYFHSWDSGVVHPWTSLLWSNGGTYVSDDHTKAEFNSDKGLQTLQLQMDMLADGSAMTGLDADNIFHAGQAAMAIMANFTGASLREGMQGGIENVGVAPIPHTEGNQSVGLQYEWLWGVSNTSQHAEEAWKFLTWLNSPRQGGGSPAAGGATPAAGGASSPMGDFLTSALNAIPGRTSDQEAHRDVVEDPFVGPFVEALKTSRSEPLIPGAQEIKTTLQTQIEAAWFGQKEPQAALDEAADAADRILAEQG
jgi:multiple sugar transport system substrate-binding protein